MDTALGILSRSLQGSTAQGTSSTTPSAKPNDLFASLFSQLAGSQALQANQLARSQPLPAPTAQTLPAESRPMTDYSHQADSTPDRAAGPTTTAPSHDDGPNRAQADKSDNDRPVKSDKADGSGKDAKTAKSDKTDKTGKSAKTDKPGKDAKADKSDADDETGATEATDKAGDKDDTDAAAKDAAADADAAVAAVALPSNDPTTGDPILAVMPMAGQQMIAAKQTPGGGGGDAAPGKGTAAVGKGPQGPAAKAGPLLKGIDPRQVAAGQDAKAGDAAAGTDDAAAAGTAVGPQSATSALNGFAAALGTTAAGPNGQAAMMQARGPGDMAPQTTAAQLVQAVEAAGSGDGGGSGGADAGLRGDGGSGGAQSGAGTRMPDGTMAAGGIEATRETGGSDFAGTLASVRSARPGMPAGATDQVAVQLQHSAKDGNGSISMQLRPEELGRIDIKLDIDKQGMVNATITADRPQTLELLQRDSRSLEKALQDAGLQTDSSSLNFNLRGESGQGSNQQSFQGDGSRNPRNGQPQLAAIDDVAPVKLAVATQRYQVANGRIDVRI